MTPVYICDYIRTPIGRFGGALSSVRADDLAAIPLKALMARHAAMDWAAVSDVVYGCANQAGEDNRNVARMAVLLAGLPVEVPGTTINRLCGSGMDAVLAAARQIKAQALALAPIRADLQNGRTGQPAMGEQHRFVEPRLAATHPRLP